jgi:heat shock protein HspQ
MVYEIVFSGSPSIRSSRSEYVKFHVGQVIRHKLYGYRAVIVGWDEIASAPDEWLDQHHQGHPVSLIRLMLIIKGF